MEQDPKDPKNQPAPKQGTDLTHRDLTWFHRKVADGAEKMFAEVVTITPAIAKRMLEQNADNRPVAPKYIRQIAHDIKVGNWEINGETIIVSDDGWLNDGQNRLLGIIEADMPVQCFVVFGVKRKSRMTVDMGRARTTGHYLGMERVSNAHYCSIVAAQWAAYELGFFGKLTKNNETGITRQDTLKFYHDHKPMIDSGIAKIRSATQRTGLTGTGIITAYCILQTMDPRHTDDFFRALIEGAGLPKDNPILELRNRLIGEARALNPYQKAEMILRYWVAWKEGKQLRQRLPMRNEWPKSLEKYSREAPRSEAIA
jgi:hypothetical protein